MAVIHGNRNISAGLPPMTTTAAAAPTSARASVVARYVLAVLRIVVGWTFLWAFLDKLFGLGYATPAARAWVDGGSPTKGFLSSSTGPFAGFYHDLAGTGLANWLFMLGLLGIGTAFLLGIGMRIAAAGAATMYVMMYTVILPPETNPVTDDHILGALIVVALALLAAGDTLGLGRWWKRQPVVTRYPWLS
jgi:thiosulfate dehydrogenase (quinone) large subunit